MKLVMDSSALIAFLRREVGGHDVEKYLLDSASACIVHAINLCEVYYDTRRIDGETTAQFAIQHLSATGMSVNQECDQDLWLAAGRYKADFRRISLADCFCAALANRVDGDVVTCDHEFESIAASNLCRVRFIR